MCRVAYTSLLVPSAPSACMHGAKSGCSRVLRVPALRAYTVLLCRCCAAVVMLCPESSTFARPQAWRPHHSRASRDRQYPEGLGAHLRPPLVPAASTRGSCVSLKPVLCRLCVCARDTQPHTKTSLTRASQTNPSGVQVCLRAAVGGGRRVGV